MKKLQLLRQAIIDVCPDLAKNPDKLLTFVESGSGESVPRSGSLNFRYDFTASIILTDFAGDVDLIMATMVLWLATYQPDRADARFVQFQAEILDNQSVDLELKVPLTESVSVNQGADGSLTATHLAEPVYNTDFPDTSLQEWEQANGL